MAEYPTLEEFYDAPEEEFTAFRDLPQNVVLQVIERHTAKTKFGMKHFAMLQVKGGDTWSVIMPSTFESTAARYHVKLDSESPIYMRYQGMRALGAGKTCHSYQLLQA